MTSPPLGKTTRSLICVTSVETAAHTGINCVLMIYLFIFGSRKRQTLLWWSCNQKFFLLSSQFLILICSNHWHTFGLTWLSPSCSSLNYINTNPRVGLASRISVSKWSHLSSTAIVSFFSLVQVKKRQLQPLSPHHLLVSCGAEKCDGQHIGIKQNNKTVTPPFITGQLFKAGFTHTRGEAQKIRERWRSWQRIVKSGVNNWAAVLMSQTKRKDALKCTTMLWMYSAHSILCCIKSFDSSLRASNHKSKDYESQLTSFNGSEHQREKGLQCCRICSLSAAVFAVFWEFWARQDCSSAPRAVPSEVCVSEVVVVGRL